MIVVMGSRVVVLDQTDPGTASLVVALQQASYAVEAGLIGYSRIPPLLETVSDVSRLDVTMLGAMDEGELTALLGYRRLGDRVDIDRLAAHPSRFRRGLARLLLHEVHHRESDAERFDVTTGAENLPAVALYLTMGYRRLPDRAQAGGLTIARFRRP